VAQNSFSADGNKSWAEFGRSAPWYPPSALFSGTSAEGCIGSLDINCVLDVEAHYGEYRSVLRQVGFRGQILSFEPVKDSFNTLRKRAASDSKWRGFPWALGESDGSATINKYQMDTLNSFFSPSEHGARRA
jgi:hypothetical protein